MLHHIKQFHEIIIAPKLLFNCVGRAPSLTRTHTSKRTRTCTRTRINTFLASCFLTKTCSSICDTFPGPSPWWHRGLLSSYRLSCVDDKQMLEDVRMLTYAWGCPYADVCLMASLQRCIAWKISGDYKKNPAAFAADAVLLTLESRLSNTPTSKLQGQFSYSAFLPDWLGRLTCFQENWHVLSSTTSRRVSIFDRETPVHTQLHTFSDVARCRIRNPIVQVSFHVG